MVRDDGTTPRWRVVLKRVLAFVLVAGMVVAFAFNFVGSSGSDGDGSDSGRGRGHPSSTTASVPDDGVPG